MAEKMEEEEEAVEAAAKSGEESRGCCGAMDTEGLHGAREGNGVRRMCKRRVNDIT